MKAIDQVANQLNNTRTVCRKYYVHPMVFDEYLTGAIGNGKGRRSGNGRDASGSGLQADERDVVRLLRKPAAGRPTSRRGTRRS